MMITIHGLAPTTKYADVKKLIKQECKIVDFILDNLLTEDDGTKKVRIGLADENEGYKLMKCLNGYCMPGNFVVKVSPVGSKPVPSGPPGGYDSRSGYQTQQRNDYETKPNEFNRGPQGPGPRVSGGPHGPNGPGGPNKPYGSGGPSNWSSNVPNQWGSNPNMNSQVHQSNFAYGSGPVQPNAPSNYMPQHSGARPDGRPYEQGRQGPPVEPQNYGGYPPQSNAPNRRNLRSIDIRDSGNEAPSVHGGRYPPSQYQQEKPVTIMKDNFQGPTPFNINHPAGNPQPSYQQRAGNSPWQQQPQSKPEFSKSDPMPFNKSFEERKYVQGDQPRDPKNFQSKPDPYKEYEKRRGYSPTSRDPMPRRISPSRRDDLHRDPAGRREELHREPVGRMSEIGPRRSPGRMDPTQRRVSPPGRRDDPHGDRRNIPGPAGPRHDSPPRRASPSRRLVSPGRRDERQIPRYSPGRHHADKMGDKFGPDSKDPKKVRPAYEPTSQHAPNQAMYSGGYRTSTHDNTQYPGIRGEQSGTWHRHDSSAVPIKKYEDERRDSRMPMTRERGPDQAEKRYSPTRKSRSPTRRDRSPIRDRLRRNSISPRSSYSPRRSWALEKRRSPDAPPPPIWPGPNANRDPARPNRPNFLEKDEKPKHQPVWEGRSFKEEELRGRRPDERTPYDEAKLRVAKELMERESARAGTSDVYQPKFIPRDDYAERRDDYGRRDLPDRNPHGNDFELPRRPREEDRHNDYNRRRESPRRENKIDAPKDFDKDFEDIYNRAMQFKKKAEELRKSSSRKRDDFDDDRRHNENMTGDMRQRYEDHGRHREEDAPRQREDRARDGRPDDYRSRADQQIERDIRIDSTTHNAVRQKREKAIDEITRKILDKNEEYKHVEGEQRRYIIEELKNVVSNIVFDMFGDSDVSFIEIVIKYQAKYNLKDEAKILEDVMRSLPKQFRTTKRHAPESMDVPAKTSRISPSADVNQGSTRPKLSDSNFNVKLAPPVVISMPCTGVSQAPQVLDQSMMPMMVSAPFYQSFDNLQHNLQNAVYVPEPVPPVVEFPQPVAPVAESDLPPFTEEDDKQEGYKLYLCRDDSERISHMEADLLKDYLISQMVQTTEQYQGWSPDFTFKGLQSLYRYEVVTKDEWSRDWLINLDFSEFGYFAVLVYTKEELWYERAAIWLPGHSRVRNIEPLEKLKLQNKKLDGVNIHKWKFVKKIVNEKGTRLYVDMPPSCARALEGHDMKLSYELQQVNVFPKAISVDKNSFDVGLKEHSISDPVIITEAIKNSSMPVLTNDLSLVKIMLKGSKTLDLVQARKIKEIVIYNLFQYHRHGGPLRTDFVKYGFMQPNYFAILPLNQESKRWLLGCSFGKVNRQAVIVVGGDESNTRFFKMTVMIPYERQLRTGHLIERLKHSNQGVKNINFHMWKATQIKSNDSYRLKYEVEIDLESLETLASMRYQLDYIDSHGLHAVCLKSEYSQSELDNIIKNFKTEMTDSYDVANMDLESSVSKSDSDDDDVICLE